jgi:hypothetical protein
MRGDGTLANAAVVERGLVAFGGGFFGFGGELHGFEFAFGGWDDAIGKVVFLVAGAAADFGGLFVHEGDDGVIGEPLTFHAVVVDDIA